MRDVGILFSRQRGLYVVDKRKWRDTQGEGGRLWDLRHGLRSVLVELVPLLI